MLDPDDPSVWFNYAVPVADVRHASAVLPAVQSAFHQRHRRMRFEWTQELWHDLLPMLLDFGLKQDQTNAQMVCTPASFTPVASPDVQVRLVQPDDDLRAYRELTKSGFGSTMPVLDSDIQSLHADLASGWRYALATIADQSVGVGGYLALDGMTELVAVATHPAYRRRGVATTLTSFLVHDHFSNGGHLAYLFASDAIAQSTYAKIGFSHVATRLTATEE
ncbi:MAG: GNAT family N-acetyltransferase [Herpetosiphon sp.]|nr:GNAT family N-acetyltransferase [Herpetosiphon sp.]